jgi:starvation-inducible outer membrane lipoprotein
MATNTQWKRLLVAGLVLALTACSTAPSAQSGTAIRVGPFPCFSFLRVERCVEALQVLRQGRARAAGGIRG